MFEIKEYLGTKESDKVPMLNYMHNAISKLDLADFQQINRKKRLMALALRTPELVGILLDMARDIVDKIDFVPLTKGGRNRVLKAKNWSRKVRLKKILNPLVQDMLITGEGYLYLGAKQSGIASQLDGLSDLLKSKIWDEDILNPKFRHIASSTMIVRHDDKNITGYTQKVGEIETHYEPGEIIRITLNEIDGRVEGYTPLYSIPLQLELLWLLWQNQYDLQLKGNMPDYLVVAKNMKSSSASAKALENKLMAYNRPGNKTHGMTVLYDAEYDLERMERDTSLQFEDVGKAVSSLIANLFQYPKGRQGIKTKESAATKDSSGDNERSYWISISQIQDNISEVLDMQLFEPFFGVQMVFDKNYLHDQVVENTAMQLRLNNLKLVNDMMGITYQTRVKEEFVLDTFNNKGYELTEDDLEKSEPMMGQVPGTLNNQMPKNTLGQGMSVQDRAKKKDEEVSRERNTGKPSGV
jgi:hypothetical protein